MIFPGRFAGKIAVVTGAAQGIGQRRAFLPKPGMTPKTNLAGAAASG